MTDTAPRKRRGKQTRDEINAVQREWRRKWRREPPDEYRAARERERESRRKRERAAYAALTDDERQAALDRLDAYTAEQQAASLLTATNTGARYTESTPHSARNDPRASQRPGVMACSPERILRTHGQ